MSLEDGNTCNFKNFDERLVSFKNWRGIISPNVNPLELSRIGMYYTNEMDSVRCVFCNIEIYNWNVNDIPIREHLKYSNECVFAKMLWQEQVRNQRVNFQPLILLGLFGTTSLIIYLLKFK